MPGYDEKNEADFAAMTQQLKTALQVIKRDHSLPATEKQLAALAQCSRGTLYARKWPLEQLHQIKQQRKISLIIRAEGKNEVDSLTQMKAEIQTLQKNLNDSRAEVLHWFNENCRLEDQCKRYLLTIESLNKKVTALHEEIAELKQSQSRNSDSRFHLSLI